MITIGAIQKEEYLSESYSEQTVLCVWDTISQKRIDIPADKLMDAISFYLNTIDEMKEMEEDNGK